MDSAGGHACRCKLRWEAVREVCSPDDAAATGADKRRLRAEFEQALRSTLSLCKNEHKVSMQGGRAGCLSLRTVDGREPAVARLFGLNGRLPANGRLIRAASLCSCCCCRCGSMLSSPTQHAQHESDIQGKQRRKGKVDRLRAHVLPLCHCWRIRWHASGGTAGEQRACQLRRPRQRMRRLALHLLAICRAATEASAVQQRIERHAAHEEGFACKRAAGVNACVRSQAVKHCTLTVTHLP